MITLEVKYIGNVWGDLAPITSPLSAPMFAGNLIWMVDDGYNV